ncbi:MAG: hypothetical protein HGB14_09690, partial [Anaerolineaceae bacterium]|nr:hypothetical protein [Anaerolineaceae bacterium]
MKISIGCDEAAYSYKNAIRDMLTAKGYEVKDFGVYNEDPSMYPDTAVAVCASVIRGEADRAALIQATEILRCGGALGMAPEGTRSRTGGLLPGKNGTVYLASRAGATILPVAIWGHETATHEWQRLRRPRIYVR